MPKIQKVFKLEVTPEKFLDACSAEELIEVEMLIQTRRYQAAMDLHRNQTKLL